MIITSLKGGLGNQLFQYAAGRALAERLDVPLKFDVSWYKNSSNRFYLLDKFNIKGEEATEKEVEEIKGKGLLKFFKRSNVVTETNFEFLKDFFALPDDTYLDGDGNWQSYKYFEKISERIKEEITLKSPLPESARNLIEKIHNKSISVHIRRADYLAPKNLQVTGICGPEYYKEANDLMNGKTDSPLFIIFSDDLEWSKTLPFPSNTIFVDQSFGLKDYEEMIVMSMCKNNITANSTFSWWAAWLNRNPDKIVIAPKNWFVKRSSADLIPPTWKQI